MEITKLSKLRTNPRNPRAITEAQYERLKDSLLVFPKMLTLRPLATDGNGIVLGGNMRLRALKDIAKMSAGQIAERLQGMKTYSQKSDAEKAALVQYWREWLTRKDVPTTHESTLTDAEKDEFVMTDNASFGSWDYDAIANEWDAELVDEWGVDVWQNKDVDDVFGAGQNHPTPETPANEQDNDNHLPAELQGVDLNPDNLPKIQGVDETPFDRIIIVYPKERKGELLGLLGMADINKVVYHLDEILGGRLPSTTEAETEEE